MSQVKKRRITSNVLGAVVTIVVALCVYAYHAQLNAASATTSRKPFESKQLNQLGIISSDADYGQIIVKPVEDSQ